MNNLPREKKIAGRLALKYNLTPPVDLLQLVKKYADYTEEVLPGEVDAICIMNQAKPTVISNILQSENRKRFTLAHEIGHLCLPWHYGMISCNTDTDENVNSTEYEIMENEANSFASELLMPGDWLDSLIEKYTGNITKLVNEVSRLATVSRSAAFFSTFPRLPNGYVALVKNNFSDYVSIKRSDRDFFIPYINSYDLDWVTECSSNSGICEMDDFYIKWWQIENKIPLDYQNDFLKNIDESGLEYALEDLYSYGKGTFASNFKRLFESLPLGYFALIRYEDFQHSICSTNTKVRIPTFDSSKEAIQWFNKFTTKNFFFEFLEYEFYCGFFNSEPSNNYIKDNRNSKFILKDILEGCFDTSDAQKKCMHSINGVIGSLNNSAPRNHEAFYLMFKQRFESDNRFSNVVIHPLFESFVQNKINEILSK